MLKLIFQPGEYITPFFSAIEAAEKAQAQKFSKTVILTCAVLFNVMGNMIVNILTFGTPHCSYTLICDAFIAFFGALVYLYRPGNRKMLLRFAAEADYCVIIPSLTSKGVDYIFAVNPNHLSAVLGGLANSLSGEFFLMRLLGTPLETMIKLDLFQTACLIDSILYSSFLMNKIDRNTAKLILTMITYVSFVTKRYIITMPLKQYVQKNIDRLSCHFFVGSYISEPSILGFGTVLRVDKIKSNIHSERSVPINIQKTILHKKLM